MYVIRYVEKKYLERKTNKKKTVFSMFLEALNRCHSDMDEYVPILIKII